MSLTASSSRSLDGREIDFVGIDRRIRCWPYFFGNLMRVLLDSFPWSREWGHGQLLSPTLVAGCVREEKGKSRPNYLPTSVAYRAVRWFNPSLGFATFWSIDMDRSFLWVIPKSDGGMEGPSLVQDFSSWTSHIRSRPWSYFVREKLLPVV